MATWTGLRRQRAGQGFTLLEVLLATVLLLLLAGAVVFSFDTLQRDAGLNEAALQMEGLLHFARAQAAQTGRRVQINFEEQLDDDFYLSLGGLRVLWEPEPLEEPGVFKPLPAAAEYVERITEAVMIETVRELDVNGRELGAASGEADLLGWDPLGTEGYVSETPPINFYPDGSSDSACIVVTPWGYDDPRRIEIRLVGITGSIRRTLLADPTDDAGWSEPGETNGLDAAGSLPGEASGDPFGAPAP